MKTTPSRTIVLATLALLGVVQLASAQPQDFTEYTLEGFPPTNGFNNPNWLTTTNTAQLDDDNVFRPASNASANVFYSPESALGKRITGTLQPGNGESVDDDIIGFVLGFEPGDAEFPPNFGFSDAEYLLIDWKGVDQDFDFADRPDAPIVFHSSTDGGLSPAGLAISRVNGLPTADELWQHIDSEDGLDGGVTELQRGLSLGRTPYDRGEEAGDRQYGVEILYTEERVAVFIDNVLELDVNGSFPDGRFGLYTAWQGPTPVFSDFEFEDASNFELPDFPTATVDRSTGELTLQAPSSSATEFIGYRIESANGGLIESEWLSIADNYDAGNANSVDGDDWTVSDATSNELVEAESGGADGASLAAGESISLGGVWKQSQFEDLVVKVELTEGFSIPVLPEFVGGEPFSRADLNTDGKVDVDDWLLFFPNTLGEFDELTPVDAWLLGDLDGDFDNDLTDFEIFKSDFESINGIGAFEQALAAAAVPEPSSATLLLPCILLVASMFRHRRKSVLPKVLLVCALGVSGASAQPMDFNTFTIEAFPNMDGFPDPAWDISANSMTPTGGANTSPGIVYGEENLLGSRIRGFVEPGTDDDLVGLVFGFRPGDATYADPLPTDADYLLIDWKGIDQVFDANDPDGQLPDLDGDGSPDLYNELTAGGLSPAGIGISRVSGLPNMDEFWQHADLEGNPNGGVQELQRGNTLGFTPYDRRADPLPAYEFDVIWTENLFAVLVDGALEAVQTGTFSDGRFGIYTCCQSDGPVFSDFEVLPADSLDLASVVPTGEVDRASGDITISNGTSESIDFDAYTISSPSGSLLPTWEGLADAESGAEANPGIAWVEAGRSNPNALVELFLLDAAGSTSPVTLAPGESFTLAGAYNASLEEEDLSFVFRTPDGGVSALMSFTGEATLNPLDCSGDGLVTQLDVACATADSITETLAEAGFLAGDLDFSGDVAFADFLLLSSSFGQTVDSYAAGDIDLDGQVAFSDFLALSANFGQSAGAAAVPEPSTHLLALLCVLGFGGFLRNRVRS